MMSTYQPSHHLSRHLSRNRCLLLPVISIATLLSVGCQSTGSLSASVDNQPNSPMAAKNRLQTAVNQQLRQSFDYHTQINLSNAPRRAALDNATPQQLAASSGTYSHCGDVHDAAYVRLLQEVKAAGNDIEDSQYQAQKQLIKQDYLECKQQYKAWQARRWYDCDDLEMYEDEPQSCGNDATGNKDFSFFENYDSTHTQQDLKKAHLANAYWYQPLSLTIEGSYRPMSGQFTLLPMAKYERKNLLVSINQPVYLDLKSGDVYVWADNVAPVVTQYLDERLGTGWKNKWLKVSFNDGSLPQGIGKTLLDIYLRTADRAYEQEPVAGFSYVATSSLPQLISDLDTELYQQMQQYPYSIRRSRSETTEAHQIYLHRKYFYNDVVAQYPQLAAQSDTDSDAVTEESSEQTDTDTSTMIDELTSKKLLTQFLSWMKTKIDEYEADETGKDPIQMQSHRQLSEDYYGLDNQGKLQWWYFRLLRPVDDDADYDDLEHDDADIADATRVDSEDKAEAASTDYKAILKASTNNGNAEHTNEENNIDVLTTFSYRNLKPVAFPNLPDSVQTPNADNSIDVKQYTQQLIQRYDGGEGTAIGKFMYQLYQLKYSQYRDYDSYDEDDYDYYHDDDSYYENSYYENSYDVEISDASVEAYTDATQTVADKDAEYQSAICKASQAAAAATCAASYGTMESTAAESDAEKTCVAFQLANDADYQAQCGGQ